MESQIYILVDREGQIADRGNAWDISRKYYTTKDTVYKAVKQKFWYVGEYHVYKEPREDMRDVPVVRED